MNIEFWLFLLPVSLNMCLDVSNSNRNQQTLSLSLRNKFQLIFMSILPLFLFIIKTKVWTMISVWFVLMLNLVTRHIEIENKEQAEVISKYLFSLIIGFLLISNLFVSSLESSSYFLWPIETGDQHLNVFFNSALAATVFGGLVLIFGLPPLQQGWVDLNDVFSHQIGGRSPAAILLGLAMGFVGLESVLKHQLNHLDLELMAGALILLSGLSRIISLVQMSVLRTFAYQDSFLFISPFFGLSVTKGAKIFGLDLGIICVLQCVISVSIYSFLRPGLYASIENMKMQWNSKDSRLFRVRLTTATLIDLIQGINLLIISLFLEKFGLTFCLVFYLLSVQCLFLRFRKLQLPHSEVGLS